MEALKKSVMKYFKFSGICFICNLCVEKYAMEIDRGYGRRKLTYSGEVLKENHSRINNRIVFCLGCRFSFLSTVLSLCCQIC